MITVKFPTLPSSTNAPFTAVGQGFTTSSGGALGRGVIFISHVANVGNVIAVGTLDANDHFTDGLVWISYAGEGTLSYLVMGGVAVKGGANLDLLDPRVQTAVWADQDDGYRLKMSNG